jgi:hypothetical protein
VHFVQPNTAYLKLNMNCWVLCDMIERQFSAEVEGERFELAYGKRSRSEVNENERNPGMAHAIEGPVRKSGF